MAEYDQVSHNLAAIRERITAACARTGRAEGDISLMAVTKFHPVDAVKAAYDSGLRLFGESRVQEAEGKIPEFLDSNPDARFEMIGHLQSNKAKAAVKIFSRIQSADSADIIRELEKKASQAGITIRVLLELHTGEESKAGFRDLDELMRALDETADCTHVVPDGLMTMAPYTKEEMPVRKSFRALVSAQAVLESRYPNLALKTLSMGMSNDYEIAVEEGSTLLRIGTSLFGARI